MAADIVAQLPQLEAMASVLYNSQVPQERAQAEQMLRVFATSTEYVPHCKAILDSSSSPYAQLLATSSLIKIVTEHSMATQVRLIVADCHCASCIELDGAAGCCEAQHGHAGAQLVGRLEGRLASFGDWRQSCREAQLGHACAEPVEPAADCSCLLAVF
jgi:hypothetical protein